MGSIEYGRGMKTKWIAWKAKFLGQSFTVKNRGQGRESDGREFELD
jgi:hypothetical protein